MTPMQVYGNNVLNALEEGKVLAVLTLYDNDILPSVNQGKRLDIRHYLVNTLEMDPESADYWLEWFKVTDTTMPKFEIHLSENDEFYIIAQRNRCGKVELYLTAQLDLSDVGNNRPLEDFHFSTKEKAENAIQAYKRMVQSVV